MPHIAGPWQRASLQLVSDSPPCRLQVQTSSNTTNLIVKLADQPDPCWVRVWGHAGQRAAAASPVSCPVPCKQFGTWSCIVVPSTACCTSIFIVAAHLDLATLCDMVWPALPPTACFSCLLHCPPAGMTNISTTTPPRISWPACGPLNSHVVLSCTRATQRRKPPEHTWGQRGRPQTCLLPVCTATAAFGWVLCTLLPAVSCTELAHLPGCSILCAVQLPVKKAFKGSVPGPLRVCNVNLALPHFMCSH